MGFERINLPALQHDGSQKQQSGGNLHSGLDPAYCLKKAELLFGCYSRDQANNPEIYSAAIAAILQGYQERVVERVVDPRTGIASRCKFLPSVAEVKACCDDEAAILYRLSQPARSPRTWRPGDVDYNAPGRRARVFVHVDAPQYPAALEWSQTAAPPDWKLDPEGRSGIWVNLDCPAISGARRIGIV